MVLEIDVYEDLMCVKVCLGCDFLHTGAPVAVSPKEFRLATKPRQARRTSTDGVVATPHATRMLYFFKVTDPLTLIHARVCTV